MVTAQKQKH